MPSRTMVVMKLDVVAKHWQALRQLHDPGDNCRDPEFPVPLGGWKLEINENRGLFWLVDASCEATTDWIYTGKKKRIGCD